MASEFCEKLSVLCVTTIAVGTGGAWGVAATALAVPAVWSSYRRLTTCPHTQAVRAAAHEAETAWKAALKASAEFQSVPFDHVEQALASVIDQIALERDALDHIDWKMDALPTLIVEAAQAQSPEFIAPHEYAVANSNALRLLATNIFDTLRALPTFEATIMPVFRESVAAGFKAVLQGQTAADDKLNAILSAIKDTKGVPEETVIALAQRIAPETNSTEQALKEMEAAIEIALEVRQYRVGSNLGSEVDDILARLADLTNAGELDQAAALADEELAAWEAHQQEMQAKGIALLEAGIDQDYLRRDAAAIVKKLVRKAGLGCVAGESLFHALASAWREWYERGRDKGLNLDLAIAIDLAEQSLKHADDQDERGSALVYLGTALQTIGERDSDTARLQQAVDAYRAALMERTQDRVPLQWAMTQNNLAQALAELAHRTDEPAIFPASFDEALTCIDDALAVFHTAKAEHYITVANAVRERIVAYRDYGDGG